MKTILALSLLLAALGALLAFVPLSFEVVVSASFAAGLIGILVADYAHLVHPLRLQLAPALVAPGREPLRLAA